MATLSGPATIRIHKPAHLNVGGLLKIWAFGLFLFLPVLLSLFLASLFRLGLQTLLIPIAALVGTAFFIPFGQGNLYVRKLARSIPGESADGQSFVVQLALRPRICSGLRALIEDADDFGRLTVGSAGVLFEGDAVHLWLPVASIGGVSGKNVGARGRFISAGRITVETVGLGNIEGFEVAERSALLLGDSGRNTMRLYEALWEAWKQAGKKVSPAAPHPSQP